MKAVIFTEGGNKIGFGHLTRCLSLHQAFESNSITSKLIIYGDSAVRGLLGKTKFRLLEWMRRETEFLSIVRGANIVVFDSYLTGVEFYRRIASKLKLAVYIDDNNRIKYANGVVVNGSIDAERIKYPVGNSYLLGVKYQPVRNVFWSVHRKRINKELRSVLVTFGGDDARHMSLKVLNFLNKEYPAFTKNVMIGKGFDGVDELRKIKDPRCKLYYFPDSATMKNVMLDSDIAISAGGQTLYELARMGIPTIGVCVADNQLRNLQGWHRHKVVDFIGMYNDKKLFNKLKVSLEGLKSPDVRRIKSGRGQKLIDGRGAKRIVTCLSKLYNAKEIIGGKK
jgi:spore coat polysaccharide biosynthesis predicted glycosyltransferase SpsG